MNVIKRKYLQHRASISRDHRAYFLNWATFGVPLHLVLRVAPELFRSGADRVSLLEELALTMAVVAGLWILSAVAATLAAVEEDARGAMLKTVSAHSFIAGFRVLVLTLGIRLTLLNLSMETEWWDWASRVFALPILIGCWFALLELMESLYTGAEAIERYVRATLFGDDRRR